MLLLFMPKSEVGERVRKFVVQGECRMKRDEGDWKWSLNSTGHIFGQILVDRCSELCIKADQPEGSLSRKEEEHPPFTVYNQSKVQLRLKPLLPLRNLHPAGIGGTSPLRDPLPTNP